MDMTMLKVNNPHIKTLLITLGANSVFLCNQFSLHDIINDIITLKKGVTYEKTHNNQYHYFNCHRDI